MMSYHWDISRLSPDISDVLSRANRHANALNHEWVDTDHVLLAIVEESDGPVANVISSTGITYAAIRTELLRLRPRGPLVSVGKLPKTADTNCALDNSFGVANRLQSDYVETAHLFVGLLLVERSVAAHILANLGSQASSLSAATLQIIEDHNSF